MKRSQWKWRRASGFLVMGLVAHIAGCGQNQGSNSKIGPAGGTVTGPGGSQVQVPAGAVSTPVELVITQSEDGAPSFPAGVARAGSIFAITPHGTQFLKPVTVTMPFDPTLVPAGQTPQLYQAEPGGSFAAITTTVAGTSLVAQVEHFSYFGAGAPSSLHADHLTRQCVKEALTGNVWCWGYQGPIAVGSGMPHPGAETYFPEPTRLPARSMTNVVAGPGYVCGESNGSEVWCIGAQRITKASGQDNPSTHQWVRIQVPSGLALSKLAAGESHVCGIAAPNSPDSSLSGLVYCWGEGSRGQLGRGDITAGFQPLGAVPSGMTRYVTVAAGTDFTCATRTSGEVDCWGSNDYGQISTDPDISNYVLPTPRDLTVDPAVGALVAEGKNACGVQVGGQAVCWGDNSEAQRGDGTTSAGIGNHIALSPVSSVQFKSISAGTTPCGISLDGHAYCWGNAWHGAAGNGEDQVALAKTPVRVVEPAGVTFSSVVGATTDVAACGLATDGAVFCWGDNTLFNLGLGEATPEFSSTPLRVKAVGLSRYMP